LYIKMIATKDGGSLQPPRVVDRTIETHPQNSSRSLQPLQFSIKSLIGISICLRLLEKQAH
jgi:hypothetical protein